MGLGLALKAHQEGQIEEALQQYNRALKQEIKDPRLYQNFGALLRQQEEMDKAFDVYTQGLNLYPDNLGILQNFANMLRTLNPSRSIELSFRGLQLCLRDSSIEFEQRANFYNIVIENLLQSEYIDWCQDIIQFALNDVGINPQLLKLLLLVFDAKDQPKLSSHLQVNLHSLILSKIEQTGNVDSVSLLFALADHYRVKTNLSASSYYYNLAMQRAKSLSNLSISDQESLQEMINSNSWNVGCSYLQSQDFIRGWPLFEHGLRTPAKGFQKWQRALIKPFSVDTLSIWRGESGKGKRLLLLEEQAVGDIIMFSSLLFNLFNEFSHIGLLVSERLAPIYKRSFSHQITSGLFSVYTHRNLFNHSLSPSDYDFQAAIGSICCHRFTNIQDYAPLSPFLTADNAFSLQLRNDYINQGKTVDYLVGVSWRGGSQGARVKQKSINPQLFGDFMSTFPNIRFVDLQYGDTSKCIMDWKQKGIDIVTDPRIDALKNMDNWLAQVSTCDYVVSVANTTIHGAGSLNIPTICLLSQSYDWRWLHNKQVKTSYWYPSVSIARESDSQGWDPAFSDATKFLANI